MHGHHLRLPPPREAPPRDLLMLEAPRELLARAVLPLYPLDPPLNPLGCVPLGMLRLPIDSPPRLPAVPAAERSLTPGPAVRLPAPLPSDR